MYSKRTLKNAYEMPFAALFTDNKGQKKYEASSVIVVSLVVVLLYMIVDYNMWNPIELVLIFIIIITIIHQVDDNAYAVCDSSWAISKFGRTLQPFSSANMQIGDPYREPEDSGYEALFYDDGIFYVVRESVDLAEGIAESYHAIIEELSIKDDDYEVVQACPSEFKFEGDRCVDCVIGG